MIPSTLPINLYEDGLNFWKWAMPQEKIHPITLTAFGDWIYEVGNKEIYLLSILDATSTKIADSSNEFFSKMKDAECRDDWLLEGFIIRCNAEGLNFALGQCLGWKLQPIAGGKFEFENIGVYDHKIYWHMASQIVRQVRGISA